MYRMFLAIMVLARYLRARPCTTIRYRLAGSQHFKMSSVDDEKIPSLGSMTPPFSWESYNTILYGAKCSGSIIHALVGRSGKRLDFYHCLFIVDKVGSWGVPRAQLLLPNGAATLRIRTRPPKNSLCLLCLHFDNGWLVTLSFRAKDSSTTSVYIQLFARRSIALQTTSVVLRRNKSDLALQLSMCQCSTLSYMITS